MYGYLEEFGIIHDSGELSDDYVEYDRETIEGFKTVVIKKYT